MDIFGLHLSHVIIVVLSSWLFGFITYQRSQNDVEVLMVITLVCILWVVGLDADYDKLDTTETYEDVVVSSRQPNLGVEGRFFLTSGIISNRVVYLLRKEVDEGYQDFITDGNVILRYDVELSDTGVYRITSECTHKQLYTELVFKFRFDHNISSHCKISKYELFVPNGYIELGLKPI